MGFFDNIWSGVRGLGQKVAGTVQNIAGLGRKALKSFTHVGRKVLNVTKSTPFQTALKLAEHIPLVGTVARAVDDGIQLGDKLVSRGEKADKLIDKGIGLANQVFSGKTDAQTNVQQIRGFAQEVKGLGVDTRDDIQRFRNRNRNN